MRALCSSFPSTVAHSTDAPLTLERAARAGLVHTQVVCAVVVDGQRLGCPGGARAPPPAYQALAERCMDPNPAARPSFDQALAAIRRMRPEHPALRRAPQGQAAPAPPGAVAGSGVVTGSGAAAGPASLGQRLAPGGRFAPGAEARAAHVAVSA